MTEPSFPLEDMIASRSDHRLQKRHRKHLMELMGMYADLRCPDCHSQLLAWFWFESPEWTWGPALCGRAGPVAWCNDCDQEVAYFEEIMS